MNDQNTFQRFEIKYLLTPHQKSAVLFAMKAYMEKDCHPSSTICNLYFDTPDFLLIRRSLEKPVYKEKLRMRSYGLPHSDSPVFVELKKKYQSVVYKRRLSMSLSQAENYLCKNIPPICDLSPKILSQSRQKSQILREIDYFRKFYQYLQPAVFLSYQRKAFAGIQDKTLRITFDENILWRREQLSLEKGIYGTPILPPGCTLMEIKIPDSMPLWLAKTLSEYGIHKTSFSKYGKAYEAILSKHLHQTGGLCYA